ncbi:hypothetical protein HA402_001438, partial [Bradysia odoriphaga]
RGLYIDTIASSLNFLNYISVTSKATVVKCNGKSNSKQISLTNTAHNQQLCEYTIRAYNTRVCQLRVDFHYFNVGQPSITPERPYAHCSDDRLIINGIPFDFCGTINQNHVYVPFDVQKSSDEVKLTIKLGTNSLAQWYITVNQIECSEKATTVKPDERQAPSGCLQYFYESFGLVQSFNYGGDYYGDTKYAICFNRGKKADANLVLNDISFQMDVGDNTAPGYDSKCLPLTNPGGLTEDYIMIPKAVVTGTQERATIFCSNTITGQEIISTARGPLVIEVNTDTKTTASMETGFRFRYRIV